MPWTCSLTNLLAGHVCSNSTACRNVISNGAVEPVVKNVKRISRKSQSSEEDPYITLLNIRNTHTDGLNTSPAQILLEGEQNQ